jgi:hypothetical protein
MIFQSCGIGVVVNHALKEVSQTFLLRLLLTQQVNCHNPPIHLPQLHKMPLKSTLCQLRSPLNDCLARYTVDTDLRKEGRNAA